MAAVCRRPARSASQLSTDHAANHTAVAGSSRKRAAQKRTRPPNIPPDTSRPEVISFTPGAGWHLPWSGSVGMGEECGGSANESALPPHGGEGATRLYILTIADLLYPFWHSHIPHNDVGLKGV